MCVCVCALVYINAYLHGDRGSVLYCRRPSGGSAVSRRKMSSLGCFLYVDASLTKSCFKGTDQKINTRTSPNMCTFTNTHLVTFFSASVTFATLRSSSFSLKTVELQVVHERCINIQPTISFMIHEERSQVCNVIEGE